MGRFYFHLYNKIGLARDEEGSPLPDLATARAKARDGIRSILSDEVRHGSLDLRGRLEIADAAGEVLAVIPFRDAIELHLEGDPE
jgi:hypothetical protein